MRKLEDLITQIRRETDNEDEPSSTEDKGISTEEFIQYMNDAQDRLQSLISAEYPKQLFVSEYIFNTVVAQEEYSIEDRIFLNNRLVTVEISPTGQAEDYVELEQRSHKMRRTDTQEEPNFYLPRNGKLLLNPIPNSTLPKIRVQYERDLDDLDIRRGRIASVTGAGTTGDPITAIGLETSAPAISSELDSTEVGDYICVCDKDGDVQAYNIPVSAFSSPNFTVTNFVLGSGDTLPAAGDYVTLGKYTTTHSDLSDICERYLIAYASWKILMRDSSADLKDKEREVGAMERDLVKAHGDPSRDIEYIPIIDLDAI